ncbi:MAG: DUF4392 domain-containing protein [Bacteroidota bacterium]|nr:DUF4392 domain-containing protein [Bacteroidota bacterium]
METKEQIILKYSKRNMNILYEELKDKIYLSKIAYSIWNLERGNVLIITGFYVNGHAETDGPIGAYFLAKALKSIGFNPIIISDFHCERFFSFDEEVNTIILPIEIDVETIRDLIVQYSPVSMISIERCGRNNEGLYCNMREVDISNKTAPLDIFFMEANCLTIGIGDGGNEIGMGNLYNLIKEKLSDIEPSVIACDFLIISTTSNWGAYGLISQLSELANKDLLPVFVTVKNYLNYLIELGSVDGLSGKNEPLVDGFDIETDYSIVEQLRNSSKS